METIHRTLFPAAKYGFTQAWLVGKYPVPGFQEFVWGGLIF
jgi:hypothetical protein